METERPLAATPSSSPTLTDTLPDRSGSESLITLPPRPHAIIYCEGALDNADGKTAHGLLRHSERFVITAVIDSTSGIRDAGEAIGGPTLGVPVCATLEDALRGDCENPSTHIIYGKAPASGSLTAADKRALLAAMGHGLSVISGLHQYLSQDEQFIRAAGVWGVDVEDIRMPRSTDQLRAFSDGLGAVKCPRLAILGTDCAIGKRTTATILVRQLQSRGIRVALINTGQTGLMQGSRYGVALDGIPSQFCAGELEAEILRAWQEEEPEIMIIEGQGALSHPAYCTSAFILRGSQPEAVILQHAPGRRARCDYPTMLMPNPEDEIALIQAFAPTRVIGLALNHEGLSDDERPGAINKLKAGLKVPVVDPLSADADGLTDMVLGEFPRLSTDDLGQARWMLPG